MSRREPWASAERRAEEALERCPFPKHAGRAWEEVVEDDRRYVEWLISGEGPALDPTLEERLVDLLEDAPEER